MAEYRIRKTTEIDYDQWYPLWQGYLEFYQSTLPEELSQLLWQRIHDPDHEIQARVAEAEDSSLVGLVHFFPHAHTWYASSICYLNDLFVSPDIRGGGIGEALIDAVVDEANERGWAEVYWQTQEHNQVARGLYDKITGGADGFITYSIAMQT